MYTFTLSLDEARATWSSYTHTDDYKRAARLYMASARHFDDGAITIEPSAFARAVKDSSFDSFFPLAMRDTKRLFSSRDGAIDYDTFLQALHKSPYLAYVALSSGKEIVVSAEDLSSVQQAVRPFESDYLRRVNLPDAYTQKQLNPYRVKLSDILNDICNIGFFCNSQLLFELADALVELEHTLDVCTKASKERDIRDLAIISLASIQKRQRLFGTPRLFSVTWQSPHLYRKEHLDKDIEDALLNACKGLSKWVKLNVPKYTKQSTVPLVSAIGSVLYDNGASPEDYVRDRVLLGTYGYKYNSRADLDYLNEQVGKVFREFGYDNPFLLRPSGIRAMHARKKWPIIQADTPITNIRIVAWTLALQARLRLIFPENQAIKLAFKFAADTLKNALLHGFGPCNVDLQHTDNALRRIAENYYSSDLYKEGECLCATDASGFDSSESKPLQNIMYEFMRMTWPELKCSDAYEILNEMELLVPNTMRSDTFSYAYKLDGQMTASGEVFVTAKNNLLHALMYIGALSVYYSMDPYAVCMELDKGQRWILKLMGDDNCRWLGPDRAVYEFVDKFIARCGIVNAYESGTMFLKRMWLPSKKAFTVDFGSLAKNLSGEYPRITNTVVGLGACARLLRGDDIELPWTDAFRRVLNVYAKGAQIDQFNDYRRSVVTQTMRKFERLLLNHLTPAMLESTDLRHLLETMFYSLGEQWPSEEMESIYGHFLVDITQLAAQHRILHLSRDELAVLICQRERQILTRLR
jgi:hypothetical protein